MMVGSRCSQWAVIGCIGIVCACVSGAQAAMLYESPPYDASTSTGYQGYLTAGSLNCTGVNDDGVAIGHSGKMISGGSYGPHGFAWGPAGVTFFGSIGSKDTSAYTTGITGEIAVGYADKFIGGTDHGFRGVRWDLQTGAVTELDCFPGAWYQTSAKAGVVNDAGLTAGYSKKYSGTTFLGERPVRWAAGGTSLTELDVLGTSASGSGKGTPLAINNLGTIVGVCDKYANGVYIGPRATRWDASGTAVRELDSFGVSSTGWTMSEALAINDAGSIVGWCEEYVNGADMGPRAVRWNADGSATELPGLGTDAGGKTEGRARAVNRHGVAAGYVLKYVDNYSMGSRAVRWDAGTGDVTELGNLGTVWGYAASEVYDISDNGVCVGYCTKPLYGGAATPRQATMWGSDGAAVDLNTLLPPNSGWTLYYARTISDSGIWIAGEGSYDPDGSGPLQSYQRMWLLEIPEPTTLMLLILGCGAMTRRRIWGT